MNDGLAFPFVVALILAGMGVDTAVSVLPQADLDTFFDVRSVTARRDGDTATLTVDRTVKMPIHMAFSVRVQSRIGAGWVDTCAMSSGVIFYQPDAVLPDPVTLDWWTWGECPDLPPGDARIVTTWTPEPRGMQSVTVIAEVDG